MFRTITFFENHFQDFYDGLDERAQARFRFLIDVLRNVQVVSTDHAKSIVGSRGIYELRARVGSNQYRALFFFESGNLKDGGRVVILGNGFLKKNDSDYKRAVAVAEKIRAAFFEGKK